MGSLEAEEDIGKDYVILHAPIPLSRDGLPQPVSAADDWRRVAAEVPGFTRQMLDVADLLTKTEYELVFRLNSILESSGLQPVDHVSEALKLAGRGLTLAGEAAAMEQALDKFFQQIAGDDAKQCRQQWPICVGWRRMRDSASQPVRSWRVIPSATKLQHLYRDIQGDPDYEIVREAALALTKQLALMWSINV